MALDLDKMKKQLNDALESETKESLTSWLEENRIKEDTAFMNVNLQFWEKFAAPAFDKNGVIATSYFNPKKIRLPRKLKKRIKKHNFNLSHA